MSPDIASMAEYKLVRLSAFPCLILALRERLWLLHMSARASMGHRAKSAAYVMPSGRLDVTRDNAKSIMSIRAMVVTP
jgi:hypothetical protein